MADSKPGFFASTIGKVTLALIGVGALLSLCCCVGAAGWLYTMAGAPTLVGEWESTGTVSVPRDDDPDPKFALDKSEAQITFNRDGSGFFANHTGFQNSIKWKQEDPGKQSVTIELADPARPFWKKLKSPQTFDFKIEGKKLNLIPTTAPDKALVFARLEREKHINADRGVVRKKIR